MKLQLVFWLLLGHINLFSQSLIQNAAGTTRVQTEFAGAPNQVVFTANGAERMYLGANAAGFTRIDIWNANQCLFIGQGAGSVAVAGGSNNTALGFLSGEKITTGFENTFLGQSAGNATTIGSHNVAVGSAALFKNTSGNSNTGLGAFALNKNTTSSLNVAAGFSALTNNTTGSEQTAVGSNALNANTTGFFNTAIGRSALFANTTGNRNTAIGYAAGDLSASNSNCTFVGNDADNTLSGALSNSTALGNGARITASNQIRIGNSSVSSIGGFVNWTNVSDGRIKNNVLENVPGLAFIMQLRPVTYHLDVDAINRRINYVPAPGESLAEQKQTLQTGFIAQEVEKAANLLDYAFSGVDVPKNETDLYGLRYAEFVAPLVKAVQEQQAQLEAQQNEIDQLRSLVQQLLSARSEEAHESTNTTYIRVWPNPATSSWNVQLESVVEGASLNLYTPDGKWISASPARAGEQELNAKNLPAGAYVLQLAVPGQVPSNITLIKK
ncbi:MAG: tail fiber domain-containing protein [Saprospiraceae bacterium]|nr:tail fiber domain-containing protein [Saprospiraceae bacterium]